MDEQEHVQNPEWTAGQVGGGRVEERLKAGAQRKTSLKGKAGLGKGVGAAEEQLVAGQLAFHLGKAHAAGVVVEE